MILTNEQGIPLPKGSVVAVWPHVGIVGYTRSGQQVVAHNSKEHGRAVIASPEEAIGAMPFMYSLPLSVGHGEEIWQNVLYDVRRGVLWAWFDNCQDFVSRAYTGQQGSPTRDAILGGIAVVGGLAWVGNALSKPNRRRRRARG